MKRSFFGICQTLEWTFLQKLQIITNLLIATTARVVFELAFSSINIHHNMFMHMYFYFKTSCCMFFSPWRKDKKHVIAVNHFVNGTNMHLAMLQWCIYILKNYKTGGFFLIMAWMTLKSTFQTLFFYIQKLHLYSGKCMPSFCASLPSYSASCYPCS